MFDDLVTYVILQYFNKPEVLKLRYVCRQWKIVVNLIYDGRLNDERADQAIDLSMVRNMGSCFKELLLSIDNTTNWKAIFQSCSKVNSIHLIINLSKENLEVALKLFIDLIKEYSGIKSLYIIPSSKGSLPVFFLKELAFRVKNQIFNLNNVSSIPDLIEKIGPNSITQLSITFKPTSEMFRLIGKIFKSLEFLSMDFDDTSLNPDGIQGGIQERKSLIQGIPELLKLEELSIRDGDFSIYFQSSNNLPNLMSVDIYFDSIIFPEAPSNNVWPNTKRLNLNVKCIKWYGVSHHFPNVQQLSTHGNYGLLFPHSISELEKLKSLESLCLSNNSLAQMIAHNSLLVKLKEVRIFLDGAHLMLPFLTYCSKNLPHLSDLRVYTIARYESILSLLDESKYPMLRSLTKLDTSIHSDDLLDFFKYCSLAAPNLCYLELHVECYQLNSSQLNNLNFQMPSLVKFLTRQKFPIECYIQIFKIAPKLVDIGPSINDEFIQLIREALNDRDRIITCESNYL